jgi:hypothetical protein
VSNWLRVLVFALVGGFASLAIVLAAKGESKAAAGALVVAALLSPLLLEAWRPGRYALRKPTDGLPDNLIGRLKQFRIDHPGPDGILLLVVFATLALAFLTSSLVRVVKALL